MKLRCSYCQNVFEYQSQKECPICGKILKGVNSEHKKHSRYTVKPTALNKSLENEKSDGISIGRRLTEGIISAIACACSICFAFFANAMSKVGDGSSYGLPSEAAYVLICIPIYLGVTSVVMLTNASRSVLCTLGLTVHAMLIPAFYVAVKNDTWFVQMLIIMPFVSFWVRRLVNKDMSSDCDAGGEKSES